MIVKESFRRGPALGRESRLLPAPVYNRLRLLLARSETDCVFVPIRSLQYQAVIDAEEVIFVDGLGPREVEVAWQGFRPQVREALDAPVPYELVSYQPHGPDLIRRLQSEFTRALVSLEEKMRRRQAPATPQVVAFSRR